MTHMHITNFLIRHRYKISTGIILLGLGTALGYSLFHLTHRQIVTPVTLGNCENHPFINPTLDCGEIDQNITRIRNIDIQIRKIIDNEKKEGHITRASVFYRDLTTRRWFGIDDTANFYGASLLKLPLSIIYFKFAEISPNILGQKFSLPTENRNEKEMFPSYKKILTPGSEYTVQELIEGMLIDSDNNPVSVLNGHIDPIFRSNILTDLGIEQSETGSDSPERYINVRIYSNILRFLYNSSYLNLEYSNTLLEYLSRSTFTDGISKVIPKNIPVAHKFGEATQYATDGSIVSRILHDCGIVYEPTNPYIICVMTEGKDFSQMSEVIQHITKATFKFEDYQ